MASTTRRRRQLTDQEREQRRAEQRALITASVEQLRTSSGWRAYLKARRTFHSYSTRNILMILSQRATATHVAGFRAWLNLGWAVQAGQRGIRIWAPCPPTRKQIDEWQQSGADPQHKPRLGWRLATVFAQDQVAPLPPPAEPVPLQAPCREIAGATHEQLIHPLVELAGEIGYTVTFEATERGDGYCAPKTQRIVIADRLEPNGRLAVLIHELAHALLRTEPDTEQLSYAQEELVVESIAMTACELVGLATDENSIPYLATWAQSASLEVLEQTATLTDRIARRIEDRLLASTRADGHNDLDEHLDHAAGGCDPQAVIA
jgi:antirestriction protein ArdC